MTQCVWVKNSSGKIQGGTFYLFFKLTKEFPQDIVNLFRVTKRLRGRGSVKARKGNIAWDL